MVLIDQSIELKFDDIWMQVVIHQFNILRFNKTFTFIKKQKGSNLGHDDVKYGWLILKMLLY